MKQSLSYYITLFVLKLKGLKKDFSKDPIDFKKIRRADVHTPKGKFFKKNTTRKFKVLNTLVTEVQLNKNANRLILFIPGGAFISGPAQHHWDTAQAIATQTKETIWVCDYPKAPEAKISEISANIDSIYATALEKYAANQIILLGSSVGGTLIAALTQRLIQKNVNLPLKIILISPVMDATLSNPKIEQLDAIDPMLSKTGVLSAKKMCAENNDLQDVMISPLYGSFDKFPKTIFLLAENDIFYADQQLAIQKLIKAEVDIEVIEGKNMPHIWPILPVMKEAKMALNEIIARLN